MLTCYSLSEPGVTPGHRLVAPIAPDLSLGLPGQLSKRNVTVLFGQLVVLVDKCNWFLVASRPGGRLTVISAARGIATEAGRWPSRGLAGA
jgi:hypothetical protein